MCKIMRPKSNQLIVKMLNLPKNERISVDFIYRAQQPGMTKVLYRVKKGET